MKTKFISLVLFAGTLCSTQTFLEAEDLKKSYIEQIDQQKGPYFILPPLPFAYDALEPYIDTETLHLHHDKHHKTYVDNLNKAVKGTKWEGKTLLELFQAANELPDDIRNNAGGHWSHAFYWQVLNPSPERKATMQILQQEIVKTFDSMEKFREEFRTAGLERFGSGYAWLIKTKEGTLQICSTPNQDTPLMNNAPIQGEPLLVCDVWEHAYYLKYHNLRGDYLDSFFQLAFAQ